MHKLHFDHLEREIQNTTRYTFTFDQMKKTKKNKAHYRKSK